MITPDKIKYLDAAALDDAGLLDDYRALRKSIDATTDEQIRAALPTIDRAGQDLVIAYLRQGKAPDVNTRDIAKERTKAATLGEDAEKYVQAVADRQRRQQKGVNALARYDVGDLPADAERAKLPAAVQGEMLRYLTSMAREQTVLRTPAECRANEIQCRAICDQLTASNTCERFRREGGCAAKCAPWSVRNVALHCDYWPEKLLDQKERDRRLAICRQCREYSQPDEMTDAECRAATNDILRQPWAEQHPKVRCPLKRWKI